MRSRLGRMIAVAVPSVVFVSLANPLTAVLAATTGVEPASVSATVAPGGSYDVAKTVHTPAVAPITDIYFLADTTGSMSGAIDNVQANASSIMSQVKAAAPTADVRFGVGDYKDFPDDAYAYRNDATVSSDDGTGSTAQTAINAWSASGGNDWPEGQLFALHRIAQGDAGFRAGSAPVVVWFGDAPGHDPVCAAISGESADVTEASVTAELVAQHIRVLAINLEGLDDQPYLGDYYGYCSDGGSSGQATRITAATGGSYFFAPSADEVANLIISGLTSLPTAVTPAATCDTGLSVAFDPTTKTVTSGSDATFTETISVASDATPGTLDCSVDWKLNGVSAGASYVESIAITVPGGNLPPGLTVPAAQTVEYSDPLSFTVTATDPEGAPLTLSVTDLPAGLSFTDNHDGTGSVSGTADVLPGLYNVKFTASDGVTSVDKTVAITVTKDDCSLTMPTTILSNATAPTVLTATFGDGDGSAGDVSGKSISFAATDSIMTAYGPYAGTTDGTGAASTSVNWGAEVYAVNAAFAGDDYYEPCSTATATVVTVSPAAAKVTGGGWISNGTGRTAFGFNAIPDVLGLHGQIQVRTNSDKGKFHGNVVLTLTGTGNQATWTGTGTWNGMPGYGYTVSVVDNGASGAKKGDTISITIQPPKGKPVLTTSGPVPLKGGNITVH